jgi:hypothetical protein
LDTLNNDYTRACEAYEQIARTNPLDARLKNMGHTLATLKYQLDTVEAAISRKSKK